MNLIIAFWGNAPGKAGVTSNTISLGLKKFY